ncbi:hypothetical protein DBR47_14445 [Paucibacter sp. KBW04]|uniref:hypothetical protein n=1 Tax=Paucibacter sp. KBW04 TaxID=2153361 RepID=UPI000F569589|nr:hypothetical protein [Paucibacter sp. KBW04]RQO57988.1 hypothetical protein DBR47_14445 [Paucibacter sp. KBW04]
MSIDETNLPTSRAQATEAGAVRYFNGEPCPAGHIAARYTLSGYCVECQRLATQAQKAAAKAKRGAK